MASEKFRVSDAELQAGYDGAHLSAAYMRSVKAPIANKTREMSIVVVADGLEEWLRMRLKSLITDDSSQQQLAARLSALYVQPSVPMFISYGRGFEVLINTIKETLQNGTAKTPELISSLTFGITLKLSGEVSLFGLSSCQHPGGMESCSVLRHCHTVLVRDAEGSWNLSTPQEAAAVAALTAYMASHPNQVVQVSLAKAARFARKLERDTNPVGRPPLFTLEPEVDLMEATIKRLLSNVTTTTPMPSPPRVIVIGGDSRIHEVQWPEGVDVRTYSAVDGHQAVTAIRAGKTDHVFLLTRFIPHSLHGKLRAVRNYARQHSWNGSMAQLAKELRRLIALPALMPSAATETSTIPADTAPDAPAPDAPVPATLAAASTAPASPASQRETLLAMWEPRVRHIAKGLGTFTLDDMFIMLEITAESREADCVIVTLDKLVNSDREVSYGRTGDKLTFRWHEERASVPMAATLPRTATPSDMLIANARNRKDNQIMPTNSATSTNGSAVKNTAAVGEKYLVMSEGKPHLFDSLDVALEHLSIYGGTIWKQLKTRTRVEIAE